VKALPLFFTSINATVRGIYLVPVKQERASWRSIPILGYVQETIDILMYMGEKENEGNE